MLNQLLPRNADNTYHGHKLALWLLAGVVLMKVIMSLNSIFNGRYVATSADGIPLDTFTPAAAQTVVALFAIFASRFASPARVTPNSSSARDCFRSLRDTLVRGVTITACRTARTQHFTARYR